MSIVIHLHYTGKGGSARRFVREMEDSGTAAFIRAEEGNEAYAYYQSMEDPETVLLVDRWRDQAALDAHHASPAMATLAALREKYDLHMRAERFAPAEAPAEDSAFLRQ